LIPDLAPWSRFACAGHGGGGRKLDIEEEKKKKKKTGLPKSVKLKGGYGTRLHLCGCTCHLETGGR
jgi:hypothetical protein